MRDQKGDIIRAQPRSREMCGVGALLSAMRNPWCASFPEGLRPRRGKVVRRAPMRRSGGAVPPVANLKEGNAHTRGFRSLSANRTCGHSPPPHSGRAASRSDSPPTSLCRSVAHSLPLLPPCLQLVPYSPFPVPASVRQAFLLSALGQLFFSLAAIRFVSASTARFAPARRACSSSTGPLAESNSNNRSAIRSACSC